MSQYRPSLASAILAPARILPLAFVGIISVGWGLLLLPWAHYGGFSESIMPAFFTATSAATVTGLTNVDTATHWTPFGQTIILLLVQAGGLGVMTIASLVGLLVGGRMGLRSSIVVQAEMGALSLGDIRGLIRRVAITMLAFQAIVALIIIPRYRLAYFDDWGQAVWHGVFHAVNAFNNAGFSLNSDSFVGYVGDGWIIFPLSLAVFIGAMGFPVLAELYREWRVPDGWTIHTRLTVWGSMVLFFLGTFAFLMIEWSNPATLGAMSYWDRFVTGVEGGIMPRSGGFSSIDYADARTETLGVTSIMMFIGGGSASTAGGIKVTTFFLLAYVILAELRGDPEVRIGNRSVSAGTIRQALTIALLSVMWIVVSAIILIGLSSHDPIDVLFEVSSAFGTVGLSTGITPTLNTPSQIVLAFLMFLGRVGPITVATALTLRRRTLRYHLPEERPIIG